MSTFCSQQVGGEAVTQGMHRNALVDVRLIRCGMDSAVELAGAERIDRVQSGKQPAAFQYLSLTMGMPPPDTQLFEQDR
jgi:hypothetical protein